MPGIQTETPGDYSFTTAETGSYIIEVWGAQGMGDGYSFVEGGYGGYGGYSKGEINLNAGQQLTIHVGSRMEGGSSGISPLSNGGGLTSVKLNNAWLIVAGGGGGSSQGTGTTTYRGAWGGSGGGYQAPATSGANSANGRGTGGGINKSGNSGGAGSSGSTVSSGGGGGNGHPNSGYGGGSAFGEGGGGGGGSGYADTSKMTNLSGKSGERSGNGKVRIAKK
ncbi:MAG: hypothetical protein LBG74_08235 [Spirochaetaceae bacterium]|nr:hypothetical protein [Spirochaetaceae bacterium]